MAKFVAGTAVTGIAAGGDTEVLNLKGFANQGYKKLCLHLAVAAQALDACKVKIKANDAASYQEITPAAWATPTAGHRIQRTSGNLATQAAGSEGYFEMDIEGLAEVQVLVSAAVNGASVTPNYSLS